MGPKHGPALGVAVFGSPGFAGGDWDGPPANSRLRDVAAQFGIELDDSEASLSVIDEHWGEFSSDPEVRAGLGNDAGMHLGRVIVATVPGARWFVWPNGHPVVRTASGRNLDVVALASRRVTEGSPTLSAILDEARSSAT